MDSWRGTDAFFWTMGYPFFDDRRAVRLFGVVCGLCWYWKGEEGRGTRDPRAEGSGFLGWGWGWAGGAVSD